MWFVNLVLIVFVMFAPVELLIPKCTRYYMIIFAKCFAYFIASMIYFRVETFAQHAQISKNVDNTKTYCLFKRQSILS